MKKLFIALAAGLSLSLAACNPSGEVGSVPAPLASTTADEHVLTDLWLGLDFAASSAEILRDEGKLVPGTAKANQVADLLVKARDALQAASAIRRGASSGNLDAALSEARSALTKLKPLLK